ncbi:T9SS type A sorting domain-containing protein [Emticicia fontis]
MVDTCTIQAFRIEKSGDVLRPLEPSVSENDYTFQWYKNGDKVPNGARKTIQTTEEGYYILQLTSKTNPACTRASANFIGIYAPGSASSLGLFLDYKTNQLTTTRTIPGSTLEWLRNGEVLAGQSASAINYQPDGTYQVKEYYQGIIKESNEVIFYAGLVVEVIKDTFFQLGDPCRPGPYLRTTFLSDIPVDYQWYLNGVPVKDSTNNHFNPVTVGEYQVSVHIPARNRTYLSGKFRLVPSDFPKSLPIAKIDDLCNGTALLKVDDAFMQKYQFQRIVWRIDGQDIPNETLPYYRATKNGYYTFTLNYLVDSKTETCTYNSFIEFNKKPLTDLNLGYAYAGSGCVVDSFKVFVEYNKSYTYAWSRNEVLIPNAHSNELFVKDKGVYKAMVNKGDGCSRETNAVTLSGCTGPDSNQFLLLNPPIVSTDKTTVLVNEESFIKVNGCANVNFQWLKDAEPITGANQADLAIKQSGIYRLQIEKLGCTAISEPVKIVVENILSTESEPEVLVRVFPNPFDETIVIELPDGVNKQTEIRLTDVGGKLVKSWEVKGKKSNLDLREMPAGVYFLSFEIGRRQVVKKVVKEW